MLCGFAVALLATLATPSVLAEEEETVCERVTRVAKDGLTGSGATTAAAGLVAQAAQLHPYGRYRLRWGRCCRVWAAHWCSWGGGM